MTFIDALVWLGVLTFAVSGTLVAVARRFDLIGALVLAAVTAVGGGSIRDVIVGSLPPTSFRDEPLLWAVAATAVATFFLHRRRRTGRWSRTCRTAPTPSSRCWPASWPRSPCAWAVGG